MLKYECPADGAWHCIGEKITSIHAPTTLCEVDIRDDGTGWARNAGRYPCIVEYTKETTK